DIDVFAAAVIALARVAFGVLVGEQRALRREHGRAGVVLGGDQLDVVFLAARLLADGAADFRIGLLKGFDREHARFYQPGARYPPSAARSAPNGRRDGWRSCPGRSSRARPASPLRAAGAPRPNARRPAGR